MLLNIVTVFLIFFLSSTAACGTDFSGPVVSVLDGDTIEVLHSLPP
jgi:hypothetical protein